MLKLEDLIKGEIYYRDGFIFDLVNIIDYDCNNTAICIFTGEFYNKNAALSKYNANPERLANAEEKHWLNECIKANKFIEKSEALKTFKQEPMFEVGKWYKNIGKNNSCYAKCKKFENGEFYISDIILPNKKYDIYTNSSYFDYNNYKKAELLTDLTEIQPYLPDGHSNKLPISNIPNETLDRWLRETKAKNLSESELYDLILSSTTCPFYEIYQKLEGEFTSEKAKILWNKWNPKQEESSKKNKYDYEVVHCKTQEEWNFVIDTLKSTINKSSFNRYDGTYGDTDCINIDGKNYSRKYFYKKNNAKIYSFKEWCSKFGHSLPKQEQTMNEEFKVGDYIIIFNSKDDKTNAKEGSIAKVVQYPIFDDCFTKEKPGVKIEWKKLVNSLGNELSLDMQNNGEYYATMFRKALPHEIPNNSSFPEYIECISSDDDGFTVGKIYKVEDGRLTTNQNYKCCEKLSLSLKDYYSNYNFKLSTKEAYEAQQKQNNMSEEDRLLEEAKIRFPIGCTFISAYSGLYRVAFGNFKIWKDGDIVDEKNNVLYRKPTKQWAKIISLPNNEPITTTYTNKVDNFSPKVEIKDNTINITVKKSGLVTLGKLQEESKIKINYSKPVKI